MYAIQTNLYAILIALIIFSSLYSQKDFTPRNQSYFYRMIVLTILLLIVDLTSGLTNGQAGMFMRVLHSSSIVLLYSFSGFVGVYWFLYIYHYVTVDRALSKNALSVLFIPSIGIVIMALMSLFVNVLFYIDADNVYYRGSFFMVQASLMYAYGVASVGLILASIPRLPRRDWLALMSVPVFPIVGGLIQNVLYGVLLLWPMMVLSLLVVYIFIQSKRIGIDVLTGLLNRREYDIHVRTMRAIKRIKTPLGGLMIDINHFKKINDTRGHHVGDQVLRFIGETLKKVFHPEQTVFRIGGDEFFVFLKLKDGTALSTHVSALNKMVMQHNPFDFPIELSIGAACFDAAEYSDIPSFIAHVDALMYAHKGQVKKVTTPSPQL